MAYQFLMGFLIPKSYSFVNVWFGLVYLFNGISNPNGLFNTEISFHCKGLGLLICLKTNFMGYLKLIFESFVKV